MEQRSPAISDFYKLVPRDSVNDCVTDCLLLIAPCPLPDLSIELCPLCSRPLAGICNRHHLLPLSKGGKGTATILLHKICHDKIHAVLSEMELKRYYHTIEQLQQQDDIAKFIKWVQHKEPEFYDRSAKKKR